MTGIPASTLRRLGYLGPADGVRRSPVSFQDRLDFFVEGILNTDAGLPRPLDERRALIDAARNLLDRLANGDYRAVTTEVQNRTIGRSRPLSSPRPSSSPSHHPLPPSPEGQSLREGQILANTYTIQEFIGRGGTAEVYHARHRQLKTDVAIKILRSDCELDLTMRAMMEREARALLAVHDDAVIGIRDMLRHDDGRPFLVTELLRGESLETHLSQSGGLDFRQVVTLGLRLCTGLHALHASDFVHLDLSPDNIFLVDGMVSRAKLIDFGCAVPCAEGTRMRREISFAGKYSYAAPEQFSSAGTERGIGPTTDVYSLALLLAACARGTPYPMGKTEEDALACRSTPPSFYDLPGALRPLLSQMLSYEPERRPTSALSVAIALKKLVLRPEDLAMMQLPEEKWPQKLGRYIKLFSAPKKVEAEG